MKTSETLSTVFNSSRTLDQAPKKGFTSERKFELLAKDLKKSFKNQELYIDFLKAAQYCDELYGYHETTYNGPIIIPDVDGMTYTADFLNPLFAFWIMTSIDGVGDRSKVDNEVIAKTGVSYNGGNYTDLYFSVRAPRITLELIHDHFSLNPQMKFLKSFSITENPRTARLAVEFIAATLSPIIVAMILEKLGRATALDVLVETIDRAFPGADYTTSRPYGSHFQDQIEDMLDLQIYNSDYELEDYLRFIDALSKSKNRDEYPIAWWMDSIL